MMTVDIYGLDLEVEIDENKIEEYDLTDYGQVVEHYDESYVMDDGRRIAFDDSVNSWVMLGRTEE